MLYTRINRSFVSHPTRVIDARVLSDLVEASRRPCIVPPASGEEELVEVPTYAPVNVSICREAPETAERTDDCATIVPPRGEVIS